MYVFLQLRTDGSPNKHLRNMEMEGEEEKRMPADTCKRTIRQKKMDQDCAKKWVSQTEQFLTTFDIKEGNLTLTKGSPHKLEITVVPLRN